MDNNNNINTLPYNKNMDRLFTSNRFIFIFIYTNNKKEQTYTNNWSNKYHNIYNI